MAKKFSKGFERDWMFYFMNRHKFTFFGGELPKVEKSTAGKDAKQAFFIMDSTGKLLPTKHPLLLRSIIACKNAVNFQIKQWAEGYRDCGITVDEYLQEFCNPPPWVESALINSIKRMHYAVA